MKQERSQENKILDAAIQCIETVGLQAVTIRKIAEIAGVNSAAINYYFRSKDALMERVLAHSTEAAFGDWERIITDAATPPAQRLRSILLEAIEGAQKFPNLVRAHLHGPMTEGNYDTVFARRYRAFMIMARDALAREFPARKAADLELRLVSLFSAAFGMALLRGLFGELEGAALDKPESRERYLDLLLTQFQGGEP